MADDRDKSARYVLGGKRHDGSKGKKYTKWRENFLDAAEGEGDADWSMAQQFLGQDGPQGGLGAAAVRARNKRRREGYAKLMDALDDDSCRDLKKDIRTNARRSCRR